MRVGIQYGVNTDFPSLQLSSLYLSFIPAELEALDHRIQISFPRYSCNLIQ